MKLFCSQCKKVFETPENPAPGGTVECPECKTAVKVPETPTSPGAVLGDFLIKEPISRGGMGEVLLAQQISLDRPVALKVIQNKFAGDKEYAASLLREARAAAKISHPNIVQAYAVGEDNGLFYFAMEYIRGETFKQIIKREGILDFKQAAKVICEIARALAAGWNEQKMVHHDIKPDNIMLDSHGIAKLADLGLASRASGEAEAGDEVLGTPQYISPEQLTGVPTDTRSDIYSLGATFYQFVTGRFPYVAASHEEMAKMHVSGQLEPPESVNPQVPKALSAIIMKMMARRPEDRYQTPEELIRDLEQFLAAPSTPAVGRPAFGGLKTVGAPRIGGLPKIGKPAAGNKVLIPKSPGAVVSKPSVPKNPAPRTPAAAPKMTAPGPMTAPKSVPVSTPAPTGTPATAPESVPVSSAPAQPAPAESPAAAAKPEKDLAGSLAPKAHDPRKEEEATQAKAARRSGTREAVADHSALVKKILKAVYIAVGLVLLAVLAGVAVYLVAAKDRFPAAVKPYTDRFVAWVDTNFFPKKAPDSQGGAGNEIRPEFAAKVSELADNIYAAADRMAALTAADAFLNSPEGQPRNRQERETMNRLFAVYAPADETLRFVPFRTAAREAHLQRIAENRRRAEAELLKRQESERQEAERREREARRAAEIRRIQAQRQQEAKQRLAELEKSMAPHYQAMASAFFDAALRNDDAALERAIKAAANLLIPVSSSSHIEEVAIRQYKQFQDRLPEEARKMRQYIQAFGTINQQNVMTFMLDRGRLVNIVTIRPGRTQYLSNGNPVDLNVFRLPPPVRTQFFRRLDRRLKLQNCQFYYALMNRKLFQRDLGVPPPGFWQNNLNKFLQSLPPPREN